MTLTGTIKIKTDFTLSNTAGLVTAFPMLEKHGYEKGRSLFCRLCKCWIPAKAYSKDEKCPKDKW